MKKLLSVLMLSALLVSCSASLSDASPSTAGAGRDNVTSSAPDSGTAADPAEDTTDATADASSGVPEAEGYASYEGSELGGNLRYTTYKGKKITDFSFLDGLSRNFFSDTDKSDPTGSWYCGKTERDETTGEVRVIFERAADVLEAMEKYGAVYRKNEDEKVIYLTFDCGYENGYTGQILDILKEKGVKGAFFLNGQFIKTAPELVKRMLDEGHVVGNHGNNHKVMSKLTIEELFYEVESNNALLQQAVPGAPYMKYFRPPAGSCSEWDLALYQAMDLECVLYSWAYYDYAVDAQPDAASALAQMKSGLHNGSVLMFHCVGETNGLVLGDFIDYVRSEGFTIGDIRDE